MTAKVLDVTEDEYHADPCTGPSLSQSIAHILVTESPRHAWLAHPKLGGKKRPATTAMDEGKILHKLLLGEGAKFDLIRADSFRTKAAQEQRDEAIAAGRVPLLIEKFEAISTAAERIRENAKTQGFPLEGTPEVALQFTERATKGLIMCRSRLDMIAAGHVIYDIKRVSSANPKDIARRFVDNGYDIQWAAYTRAYEQLGGPDVLGRADMVYLFCEAMEPYEVVPVRPDGAIREIGMRRWMKAVRLWEDLLEAKSWPWPGYSDGAIVVSPPTYVISQELGEEWR
jgi:hypothetical protein